MSDEPKLPPDPSSAEPPTPSSDAPRETASPPPGPAAPEGTPAAPEEVPEWLQRIRARREAEQARARAAGRHAPSNDAAPRDAASPTPQAPDRPADRPTGSKPPSDLPRYIPPPAPEKPSRSESAPARPDNAESQPAAPPAKPAPPGAPGSPPEKAVPAQQAAPSGENHPDSPPAAPSPDEPPAWLNASSAPAAHTPRPDDPPWVQAAAPRPGAPPMQEAPIEAASGEPAEDTAALEAAARAARRERMAERRRERRRRERGAVSTLQSVIIVGAAAVMIATIFTFWTPASFLSDETREGLRPAYATLNAQSVPTPIPTPVWLRRIGIVSGHWGPYPDTGRSDPGAVCADGLTEASVNRNVAQRVVQALSGRGYQVDLLDEWDPRLKDYEAAAILSIHADSCHEFDLPGATGFKVAPPSSRVTARADDLRLVDCLIQNYGDVTGMSQHPSITRDMTEYHSFGEISPVTPGAIIELGFLYEDRQILTEQPDLLAQGIVAGLLCFLEAAPPTPLPELTPWPTAIATPTPLEAPGLS